MKGDEPIEVSFTFTYALTSKGVAFYAEKKLDELQAAIQQLEGDVE